MAPKRKRKDDAGEVPAKHYKNEWERLQSNPPKLAHHYLRYEALQEFSPSLLAKLPQIDIKRAFFLTAEKDLQDLYEALAAYTLAREVIRTEPIGQRQPVLKTLQERLPDKCWFRVITPKLLLEHLQQLRTTCVDNKWDRGSHRMRYITAGLLFLAAMRTRNGASLPLTGAAVTKAAAFAVVTGGPKMCTLIYNRIRVSCWH